MSEVCEKNQGVEHTLEAATASPVSAELSLRPMPPALARLKAKLGSAEPTHKETFRLSLDSVLADTPNSEATLVSSEVLRAATAETEQLSAVDGPAEASGLAPSNPVAPQKAKHIKEFTLSSPEDAVLAPSSHTLPDLANGLPQNFPHRVFPTAIQRVAAQLASVYQAPICVTEMCLLAALSAAVGKTAFVAGAVRDLPTMLNLFVVIVAERGTCKSVIAQKATAPLQSFSDALAEEHLQKLAGRKSELAVLKKEAVKLESEIGKIASGPRSDLLARLTEKNQRIAELEKGADRNVTAIVSDITGEALVRALEDNGETLCSYSPEAGSVVSVAAGKYRDGKADLDPYLSGYSGDPMRTTRVDRGSVAVQKPCLTLLWLMQSIVAFDLVGNRDTIPRGFSARTLFFDSGARREYDNRKDDSFTLASEWASLMEQQLMRRKTGIGTKEIGCTAEAREVFAKFHDEGVDWERKWCPDLVGEFSRQRENAVKVAGLFALVEKRDEIDAATAARAVEVIRWVGYNYLSLIQVERQRRLKKDFERIMEVLATAGGQINLGALAQFHGIKREKVEALLVLFPDTLELKKIPQIHGKAGRPAEVLCLKTLPTRMGAGNKIEIIEKFGGGGTAA